MSVAEWGALAAVGALALTVLAHGMTTAWRFGRLRQEQDTHADRIAQLEAAQRDRAAGDVTLATTLGQIGANVAHMMIDIADLKRGLPWRVDHDK